MKTKAVDLLAVALLAFAAGAHSAAAEVMQTTGNGSWCSPAQNGNGNTVICNFVPPSAIDRLNELLNLKDLDLKQKIAEANEWAHRYNELNAQLEETKKQLAAKGQDATLVQTAQDLLREGKLEEAHAIFDRLIQSDETDVDRAAQDHFGRANVFALQYRLDEALPDYAKAYQYRPENQRYASAYGDALVGQKEYPKAKVVLEGLVKQQRSRAAHYPDVYRPDLARTLNKLGLLDRNWHRDDAEAAFKGAADIERELAREDPAYWPVLAETLNSLGIVSRRTTHFADATAAYREAADIERELAAQNPSDYPYLAKTLNELGAVYLLAQRFTEAEAALKEAVGIERKLPAHDPAPDWPPDLATTLGDLALLYRHMHRDGDADTVEAEAAAAAK